MPGFADLFSAESIGNLMQDPRMVLGLQLLSQGRQGSGSQALGQAGSQAVQLYGEQKRQQELADYRNNLARMQQEQLTLQQQSAQAKAQQQAEYRARLADPAFLAGLSPTARMLAQLNVDPSDLIRAQSADALQAHRQAQLQQQQAQFDTRESRIGANTGSSGPRAPAPRAFVDQPLGGDQYQRFQYDPATGGYKPWGEPFNKHSQRKATTGADAIVDSVMGDEPTAAGPGMESLPGNAPMTDYMPKPQGPGPVGVMAAAGGNAQSATQAKPAMRVPNTRKPAVSGDLAAAKSAIAAGKSRQAVVNRLMQAGYTADQIKEAGI